MKARTFLMTSGPRKTTAAAPAPARKIPSTATLAHQRIARHRSTLGHSAAAAALTAVAASASPLGATSTSSGILTYSPRLPLADPGEPIDRGDAIRLASAGGHGPGLSGRGAAGSAATRAELCSGRAGSGGLGVVGEWRG